MIDVINGYKEGFEGPGIIYIGRGGRGLKGSPLANPFVLKGESDRARCIAAYDEWLKHQPKGSPAYEELIRISRLAEENDIRLACFCSPKRCHGDSIKLAISNMNRVSLEAWFD